MSGQRLKNEESEAGPTYIAADFMGSQSPRGKVGRSTMAKLHLSCALVSNDDDDDDDDNDDDEDDEDDKDDKDGEDNDGNDLLLSFTTCGSSGQEPQGNTVL